MLFQTPNQQCQSTEGKFAGKQKIAYVSDQSKRYSTEDQPVLIMQLSYQREYDTRCYINMCSKADISQLNLPHGTDN